jgi:ferredoxin
MKSGATSTSRVSWAWRLLSTVVIWLVSASVTLAFSAANNNYNPSLQETGTTKNLATQILQGVGPCSAEHMNRYNIQEIDVIAQEWTATWVQKVNDNTARFRLGCRNNTSLFVDTVSVRYPRLEGAGLGLELQEIASSSVGGNRNDLLGITLVTGLVEGGAAQAGQATILPGDSVAQISIVRSLDTKKQTTGPVEETQKIFAVDTECLGFDATVNAIQTELPPYDPNFHDMWQLTLKRLRRRPYVTINLQYPPSQNEPDTSIRLYAGENLRQGMLGRGVTLNDPLAHRFDTKSSGNCGAGGLCRTCSVIVVRGADLLNQQRVNERTMLRDSPRWRLACKAIVGYGMKEGEMTIRVNPNQW